MKTQTIIVIMSVGVFSAVGQGKISYGNTSAHPAVFNQTYMYAGDAAYDGQPIPTTVLPSGIILQAALYAGTGASSLGLQTSFTLSGANMSAPGVWVPNSMSLIGHTTLLLHMPLLKKISSRYLLHFLPPSATCAYDRTTLPERVVVTTRGTGAGSTAGIAVS